MYGFRDAEMQGCINAGVQRYRDADMLRCRDIEI